MADPEQIKKAIANAHRAGDVESAQRLAAMLQSQPPAPEATAAPAASPRMARAQQAEQAEDPSRQTPGNLLAEMASGLNRSILETVDLFPRVAEEVAAMAGVDIDLPTIQEATNLIRQRGEFAGEGLGTDIAAGIGELAPAALGGAAALAKAGSRVGPAMAGESVGKAVTREMGKTTGGLELGALTGGVVGEELGEEIGGTPGAVVGGLAGSMSGGALGQKLGRAMSSIPRQKIPALDYISNPPAVDKQPTPSAFERKSTAALREQLNEGSAEAVGYKLVDNIPVKDPLQRKLVKEGVDERAVTRLHHFNPQEREAATEMLDKAARFIKGVKGSETDRPQSVIGGSAMKRIRHLADLQEDAGQRISRAVEQDLQGQTIDAGDLRDSFIDDLATKLDIGVNEDGVLDFSESVTSGGEAKIRKAYNLIRKGSYDAERLHRVKQTLSQLIEYDKTADDPIDARAKSALGDLREGINSRLRELSDDYAQANDEFAEIAEITKPFVQALGKNYDPQSDKVSQYIGQELRKVLTNYKKGTELHAGLVQLDVLANAKGGNFQDDLASLVMFNDELERLFGSFAPGSQRGLTQQAAGVVADQVGGLTGQLVREGTNLVKSVKFNSSTKDKLELLNTMRQLAEQ